MRRPGSPIDHGDGECSRFLSGGSGDVPGKGRHPVIHDSTVELGVSGFVDLWMPRVVIWGWGFPPHLQLQCFQQAPSVLWMPGLAHSIGDQTASPKIKSPLEPKAGNLQNLTPRGSSTATLMPVEQIASGSRQSPCRLQGPSRHLRPSVRTVIRTSSLALLFRHLSPTSSHVTPSRQVTSTSLQWSRQIASPPQDKRRPRARKSRVLLLHRTAAASGGCICDSACCQVGSGRHVRYEPRPFQVKIAPYLSCQRSDANRQTSIG